jgi:hypothetical protein
MIRIAFSVTAMLLAVPLAGCLDTQTYERGPGPKYGLATLMSDQIRKCWFGAGSSGFSEYAAESDVNPVFNRARILLVPKNDLEAKPLLIVEAVDKNTTQATVSAYGPLMQGAQGARITADLKRWTSGSQACS